MFSDKYNAVIQATNVAVHQTLAEVRRCSWKSCILKIKIEKIIFTWTCTDWSFLQLENENPQEIYKLNFHKQGTEILFLYTSVL